jgi:hypothetical protein
MMMVWKARKQNQLTSEPGLARGWFIAPLKAISGESASDFVAAH